MKYPLHNSFRSKIISLFILLWAVPVIAGSPESTPSPECKAAMGLVNLAFMDVNAASENLDRAMEKTGEAIEALGRAQENFQKAMENHRKISEKAPDGGEALSPGSSFPSTGSVKRAQVVLEQVQEHERSVDSRVQQSQRNLDERLATVKSRCEVNR